jgi:ribosomal protein L40E
MPAMLPWIWIDNNTNKHIKRRIFKMDFLEALFDLGDRKRQKRGGVFQSDDHHDDDEYGDHHNHNQQYPVSPSTQVLTNPAVVLSGVVCRKCSTRTLQDAKFCHGCGTAIEVILSCASCGSKLPDNAPFCPQCGHKNG